MNFTKIEREAINFLLVKIMKADGITELHEAYALSKINKSIGITMNDADDSLKLTLEKAKEVLLNMNSQRRDFVYNLFNEMAISDGKIDITERELLDNVFNIQ